MSLHTLSQERFCELSEGITDALCGVCSSWLLVVFFIHSVPGALSLQALDSISSSWIPMEEALSNCDAVVQPLGLLRCLSQSCQAPTKLCPYMLIPWVKGTCALDLNSCLSQNQHRAHRRQGRAPAHLVLSYLCLSRLHKWASWTLPVLLKKGHSKNRRERERGQTSARSWEHSHVIYKRTSTPEKYTQSFVTYGQLGPSSCHW